MGLIANPPGYIAGFYDRRLYVNAPTILMGYILPMLPALSGASVVSDVDGSALARGSFSDMGVGEIMKCGFLAQGSPAPYIQDGFESGTLDGFIISSTNAALVGNEIAVIDTITTSGAISQYAVKLCSSGALKISKLSCSVTGPMDFSFSWKVSSETNYDKLNWYLDGVLKESISGEIGWQTKTTALLAGTHTIDFTYSKNSSGERGSDCGWIDDVTFGMQAPTIYEAQTIPTEAGQEFTASLTGLPSGVVYIAAFADNGAGRAMSEFIPYRNVSGWQGGLIYNLQPDAFSHFVMGNTLIPRSKVNQVIVGKLEL